MIQLPCDSRQRPHFARACAIEMHMDISQSRAILHENCQEKRRGPTWDNPGTHILCELARSKCTWTFHKSNLMGESTGKMLVEMLMNISEEQFSARMCNKNAGGQMEHPDLTPALTPTVRTFQSKHTACGKLYSHQWRIR